MLLGSDGPGGIYFDDVELARTVGTVALAAILFEGGLSTSWRRLRRVAVPAVLLATVGVVVTAILTGVAAYYLFDLSRLQSVLLGAVVASTDAAAVFATLRFTHIRRRLARTLEAETGVNDPVAIALTIGLIDWIEGPSFDLPDLLLLVIQQLGLGLVVGVGLGALASWLFARLPPAIGAFAPVASVSAGALSFGVADVIGGSGFLAVYLVGLAVGSTPSRHRRQLVVFHAGLAFLAQVTMLVVLGLLVFPSDLPAIALSGLALAALLMVVIRPVAVWVSTPFGNFTARERALLGWAGLRGAVPIRSANTTTTMKTALKIVSASPTSEESTKVASTVRRWNGSPHVSGSSTLGRRPWHLRSRSTRWARSSWSSSTSRATTRSPALSCASSGCRAAARTPERCPARRQRPTLASAASTGSPR